jgi:hypothetical protein
MLRGIDDRGLVAASLLGGIHGHVGGTEGIGGIMDGKAADRGDPNAGAYARPSCKQGILYFRMNRVENCGSPPWSPNARDQRHPQLGMGDLPGPGPPAQLIGILC